MIMVPLMTLLSTLFWSLWRRLYGEGKFKEILSRTLQTIIAILVLAYQFNTEWTWRSILIALAVSIWVIIQYFSRSVGEIIDAGLNPCQTRKDYDRWFRPICNWIVDGLNWIIDKLHISKHIKKYYGIYDWIYSSMRNFWGVLPAIFLYPSCWWLTIFTFYPVYLLCYKVFEHWNTLWSNTLLKKLYLNEPKNWAELICGALFGFTVA